MSSISSFGNYGDFEIPNSGITIYRPNINSKNIMILKNHMHLNDVSENIYTVSKNTFIMALNNR
jgi:hypothetical protein